MDQKEETQGIETESLRARAAKWRVLALTFYDQRMIALVDECAAELELRDLAAALADVLEEAAQARNLSATFRDAGSVRDLLQYAADLEADAHLMNRDMALAESHEHRCAA